MSDKKAALIDYLNLFTLMSLAKKCRTMTTKIELITENTNDVIQLAKIQ